MKQKRICPTCKKFTTIYITRGSDGWEVWLCSLCGCRNEYQIVGRVN